jgi:hypothetical protein
MKKLAPHVSSEIRFTLGKKQGAHVKKVNYISVVKGDNLRTIQTILGLILHSYLGFQKWPNLHNQKISDTNNLKCRYFGNIKIKSVISLSGHIKI